MTAHRPATDRGLQNERTSLAWRRTGLSLVVAAGTMAKLTASNWQALSVIWLMLGIPVGLAVLVASSTRYRDRQIDYLARTPWSAILLAAVSTTLIGALSLAYVAG